MKRGVLARRGGHALKARERDGAAPPPPPPEPAPAITSPVDWTNVETRPLLETIELDRPGYLSIGGADAGRFELVALVQPGRRFRLRYAGDGTKDHEAPDDADGDGVYRLLLTARGLGGAEASRSATVRLLDLDEVPDDFDLPPLTGVPRSTLHAAPVVTVSGLAAGYAAPVSASHPYVKNGAPPTGVPGTVVNGDVLTFPPVLAAADYAQTVERSLTVGPITRVFRVTTEAAPAAAAWAASSVVPAFRNLGFAASAASFPGIDFVAGLGVVFVAPHGSGREVTGVTVGGVAATRRLVTTAGDEASLWTAPVAAAGAKNVVVTYNYAPGEVGIITGTVLDAGLGPPAATALRNPGFAFSPPHRTDGPLAVPTGGVGVLFAFNGDGAAFAYASGLTATSAGTKLGTAVAAATLTPGIEAPNGYVALLAASWAPGG